MFCSMMLNTRSLSFSPARAMQKKDWAEWIKRLDDDPKIYLPNAYAVEFLRHNLAAERLRCFKFQLFTVLEEISDASSLAAHVEQR